MHGDSAGADARPRGLSRWPASRRRSHRCRTISAAAPESLCGESPGRTMSFATTPGNSAVVSGHSPQEARARRRSRPGTNVARSRAQLQCPAGVDVLDGRPRHVERPKHVHHTYAAAGHHHPRVPVQAPGSAADEQQPGPRVPDSVPAVGGDAQGSSRHRPPSRLPASTRPNIGRNVSSASPFDVLDVRLPTWRHRVMPTRRIHDMNESKGSTRESSRGQPPRHRLLGRRRVVSGGRRRFVHV